MDRLTNPTYLKSQYKTADNLNARIQLHELYSTNTYPWTDWLFDQWVLPAASRILEVGCGPAYMWPQLLERIPPGWEVILSDISPGMVGQAREALAGVGPQFRFAQSDIQRLPWLEGTFDAVIANHMLYHVPDRPRALAEIRRVLKPGGKLYAATNGDSHMA